MADCQTPPLLSRKKEPLERCKPAGSGYGRGCLIFRTAFGLISAAEPSIDTKWESIIVFYVWMFVWSVDMKILKIDHLGIAVSSIDDKKNFWTDVLGLTLEGTETVEEQKVTTAFLPVGESEVELLESTSEDGPVAKYIEKKGEGIQHVAFRVENIDQALEELKEKGIALIDKTPRIGAGGARIAFLHPKATSGVLVELCER